MLLALGCLPGTNVLAASLAAVAAQSHSAARVALPAEAPSVPTHGYVVVNQLMACAWTRYAQHDGSDGDAVQLWRCQSRPGPRSSQLWQVSVSPVPEVLNNAHGLCLDAQRRHHGSNGDPVQLWRCVNVVHEQWNWVAQ